MDRNTKNFIEKHINDDVHTLALQAAKYPEVDMELAICQITGMQKVKQKIPAFYRCAELLYPARLSLEQASSEITAKHKLKCCQGNTIIDLTGGFGVDAYFFSFNFDKVVYVEKQKELCELAKHNFKALGRENIEVRNESAENRLEKTGKADWIFIDPARRTKSGKKAVLLADCEPDVSGLKHTLVEKAEKIMIKLSPMIDVASVIKELPHASEIQIIAVENECKEVLVILKSGKSDKIEIKTINYVKNSSPEVFDFILSDEKQTAATPCDTLLTYLYEPNAALLKSGAFKLISERFDVHKLHVNSHLYTSNMFIPEFPGRIFSVDDVYDFSKESVKKLQSCITRANLTVRNFPASAIELRKKLRIMDGGDDYLFATTLSDGKKILIRATKTPR